ncbi:MAG: hypothetical protein A2Z91_00365 [Deltaproteobacteria bacterium GWA2_38_16]|nr:MAG: hypothetical protein A2Z91_00365 [Deltaproteobacteria bacterium GWA2_38_16]OGQ03556.1 MAG: hypothetical protein A3D19_01770 [Deltaproteobacteria bacterium RIFCSPHIGHO2_02_FULL_38_15]OGQ33262.1 MAG: hypothetical protein A3A72_04795 [Deltaproteobacteria bacterium RIFCSPLOWO2_01_FULL_38_9]OGQ61429.1 MAG: hypothetical protein A3G92_04300 [Deltaproteobacteria bacterium RIFCSPLOWO2_12_FULL_38_8]HBQ21202.1 hypothetical protein [Deltaproteobacteria bacterium]
MKNIIILLLGLLATNAYATGPEVGNGGDAVVYFSIPLEQAIANGKITEEGLQSIDKVEILDFYDVKLLAESNPADIALNIPTEDSAKAIAKNIRDRIQPLFTFYYQWLKTAEYLESSFTWIKAPDGVRDVQDSAEFYYLPKNACLVQVVVRDSANNIIYYDPRIFNKLDETQKAILYLHEELYLWANLFSNKRDQVSGSTLVQLQYAIPRHQIIPIEKNISNSTSIRQFLAMILTEAHPEKIQIHPTWETPGAYGKYRNFLYTALKSGTILHIERYRTWVDKTLAHLNVIDYEFRRFETTSKPKENPRTWDNHTLENRYNDFWRFRKIETRDNDLLERSVDMLNMFNQVDDNLVALFLNPSKNEHYRVNIHASINDLRSAMEENLKPLLELSQGQTPQEDK